ncbi:hypothetical protein LTR08_001767 [Meristemomyces frigidus]|nr:hypothetical protein LTR08_001767 [Meristemomyces frigidus]
MSGSLSAGIAWAVPVRPDVLGAHLEAYEKALPIINALRLCHRFGQGPDAHITRIPVELEQAIEEFVLDARRTCWHSWSEPDWKSEFSCFESTCEPNGHCDQMSGILDGAYDTLEACESCAEHGVWQAVCDKRCTKESTNTCDVCKSDPESKQCERACLARYDEIVNESVQESDLCFEAHEENKSRWERRIQQGVKDPFEKYDKILRVHFGLEVFFANTRPDDNNDECWPKHKNHRWHSDGERQTTLCYLTLPKKSGPKGEYTADDRYMDGGYCSVPCAQAIQMKLPTVTSTTKMRVRFQRAMRILDLKPSVHSSQDHGIVLSPELTTDEKEDGKVEEGLAALPKDQHGSTRTQWPQLMLLVTSQFSLG